jgi:hypothetical protein
MLIPGSASQHISRRTQHVRHQPMWFVTTTTEEHHEQQQTTRSRVQQKTRQRGDNPEQGPQKDINKQRVLHMWGTTTHQCINTERREQKQIHISANTKRNKRHTFQKLISHGDDGSSSTGIQAIVILQFLFRYTFEASPVQLLVEKCVRVLVEVRLQHCLQPISQRSTIQRERILHWAV